MSISRNPIAAALVFLLAAFTLSCGDDGPSPTPDPVGHLVLGDLTEVFVDSTGRVSSDAPAALAKRLAEFASTSAGESAPAVTVDYPLDGSIFPPEFIPPTFLWHDAAEAADTWLVTIDFEDEADGVIRVLLPGASPPQGEIDRAAISPTNEVYTGTEYQNSARSWKPSDELWGEIKSRSAEKVVTITFTGIAAAAPTVLLSRGTTRIQTSKDPVGAPFLYRDVPLMPAMGKHGTIVPLGVQAIPLIAWRLRDVSLEEPKLVLKGMPSCGNCHSFSRDGQTLGMDVDGPGGDKGMYAIKKIEEQTVIGSDDVITWNSYPDKPKDHRTIGFMSRVSPDGRWVASTVNEELFVMNFQDHRFLQVFYPTGGILAVYSRDEEKFSPLPGADDPEYVHCSPVWTPDMKWVIFSRAKGFTPFHHGMAMPEEPNDPREPQIRYDLYRIPFNDGKGGAPEPIEGASSNGFSNTFPKVSPDGKWIVWTRCKNGLLMRPDGELYIVPVEGGEPRRMTCNTPLMNSWHSFSPNGRWMVFSSKSRTPYTQAFLTHIDEEGNDSPAILVPNCTAANRALNLPEFLNAPYAALDTIEVPVVDHHIHALKAERLIAKSEFEGARDELLLAVEKDSTFVRALVALGYVLMQLDEFDRALLPLEEASRLDPAALHAIFNRAWCYDQTGRPHLAKRMVEHLLELAPAFPDTEEIHERAVKAAQRLDLAISGAEKALAADPGSLRILQDLAEMYRRAGRLEKAVEVLGKAVELSEEAPPVLARLAWLLATNPDDGIRDGKRAVKLAERAVELTGGKRPEPLDALSVAYAEIGEFEKAADASRRAVGLAKKFAPDAVPYFEEHGRLIAKGKPIRTARDR